MRRKKVRKLYLGLIFVLLSILAIMMISEYCKKVNERLASGVVRLHVIANSDSKEDQQLKYNIRDNILQYMKHNQDMIYSSSDRLEVSPKLLSELNQVAFGAAKGQPTTVEYGNFYFPTKTYGDVSFPAGNYNAVRVKVGQAKGQNWWCVMFPPICMVDSVTGKLEGSSKELLQENLEPEDYELVTSSEPKIKLKFKILEWFSK